MKKNELISFPSTLYTKYHYYNFLFLIKSDGSLTYFKKHKKYFDIFYKMFKI